MHSPCIRVDSFLSASTPHPYTLPARTRTLLCCSRTGRPLAYCDSRTYHTDDQFPGHSSCQLHVVRLRRAAPESCAQIVLEELQYTSFPIPDHRTHMHTLHHNTPHSPDTHIQLSPQHPTFTHTLAADDACLVYQRLLVNSYCTSDLCRPRRLARPPSASRRTFGHSKMSDPTDTWFPRPSTPPAKG